MTVKLISTTTPSALMLSITTNHHMHHHMHLNLPSPLSERNRLGLPDDDKLDSSTTRGGNQPDENGGLNQPAPWVVEYSKTGRATCRSCDAKIVKCDVRIGHTPLFRGKPEYMVYRHLHCAVFSEEIQCAEDVENYDVLEKEDYAELVEQVRTSQTKIQKEYKELRPDELVQGCFNGKDMRSEQPRGLNATLLLFQVEGYSWMYHQEVKQGDVRGGILADKMVPKKFIRSSRGGAGGGARAETLVVCPVIALTQWKTEIEKFTDDGRLTVCTYRGPDRASQGNTMWRSPHIKMTSPNRVECPNCGGKFKIDKLPIHLKYFCGDTAERTEAQARQQRNSDRDGGNRKRGRRSLRTLEIDSNSDSDSGPQEMVMRKKKESIKLKTTSKVKTPAAKMSSKKGGSSTRKVSMVAVRNDAVSPRQRTQRKAALDAASHISRSAADWCTHVDDDKNDDAASDSRPESSCEDEDLSDSSSSTREKQRQALEMSKAKRMRVTMQKEQTASKSKGKKVAMKKKARKLKGKKKKFDDESTSSSDRPSGDDMDEDEVDEIDMEALVEQAMAGAKNSVLHSLCWWRIILDEAHFIKTRSSQTANAAFSLIGVHRWCLSGTPLQNRVGEFYSLVRFLRLDPMGYYYCRVKDCTCKSMHYRMHAGICECCGHGGIQHYSHFNKYILNPIQRDGYSGDGRRAMFLLKNEVLDKAMLRRTKESRAADMELPPRLVQIQPVRLHPVEEDFYSALYTQTKTSFDSFVDSGTLLNNYAHIFDLLIRMRQSVDHPYLVIHSKKDVAGQEALSRQVRDDCELCHEPPTDRVVSTCCSASFCRACIMEFMATSSAMSSSANIEDDSSLNVALGAKSNGPSSGMPSLKELQHVATGSILRRINLAEFATSSKIEALTRELVIMRQISPGSKAIVFSQFVNMLDLIRWRLHSDPYLEDIGLGCRALHGGMNVKARDDCLREFREDNTVRVLLMSLKAGGVALNLTCANQIFLMDPWWNPAAEMQAIDRTHRLGQYRPIRAVRFIAENTVEERILQLQEKKRLVFDGTVGRDAASLKMLTVDDMKSLFT
ncbi:hypothetical protein ACHAXH_003095 [Discostella pseudostelligera]